MKKIRIAYNGLRMLLNLSKYKGDSEMCVNLNILSLVSYYENSMNIIIYLNK